MTALERVRETRAEHHRLFEECKRAHKASNEALIAARNAGHSWEEIADAGGWRSSLGPEVAAHSLRAFCIALWRSGHYGPVPDEALFKYELRQRAKGKLQYPQEVTHD